MAKELQAQYASGRTVYVVVLSALGKIWNTSTSLFEVPTAANWAQYAIAAAEQGMTGIYEANMAAVPIGVCRINFYLQLGLSPATSDVMIGTGSIRWSGAAEVQNLSVADAYLQARIRGAIDPIDGEGRQLFRSPPDAPDAGVPKVRFDPIPDGRVVELDPV